MTQLCGRPGPRHCWRNRRALPALSPSSSWGVVPSTLYKCTWYLASGTLNLVPCTFQAIFQPTSDYLGRCCEPRRLTGRIVLVAVDADWQGRGEVSGIGLEGWMERWEVEAVQVRRPRLRWISCREVNLLLGIVERHQLLEPQLAGVEDAGHPVHLIPLLLLQGLVN